MNIGNVPQSTQGKSVNGRRVNQYILEKVVGKGSFAEVWLGRDSTNDKLVAIKKIPKERLKSNATLIRMLSTEVSVMKKIKHRNIMHLEDFLETPSNYYLILEYLKDGDLEGIIKKTKLGYVDEPTAVFYLKQIANGFQELRNYKVFHRDIKLANLFLDNNRIVIGDFGFAKSGVDQTSTILGTPLTMAPEILFASSGDVKYCSKADIWSIGVVFYQLLFGKLPFPGSTIDEIKKNITQYSGANLRFPGPISQESKILLQRMLTRDVATRLDWHELFNHAVFNKFPLPDSLSKLAICPYCRSANHTNNTCEGSNDQKKTDADFQQHAIQAKNIKEFEYAGDETLQNKFSLPTNKAEEKELSLEEITRLSVRELSEFFEHELKKCGFFVIAGNLMLSALRNPLFAPQAVALASGASICFKKALFLSVTNLMKLRSKENVFGLKDGAFKIFCSSTSFSNVTSKYENEIANTQTSFKECEKFIANIPRAEVVKKTVQNPYPNVSDIDSLLNSVNKNFSAFHTSPELQASPDNLRLFYLITLSLKCVINCQTVLCFMNNETPPKKFSWAVFFTSFNNLTLDLLKNIFAQNTINVNMIIR